MRGAGYPWHLRFALPSHRRTGPLRLTGETRYPRWGRGGAPHSYYGSRCPHFPPSPTPTSIPDSDRHPRLRSGTHTTPPCPHRLPVVPSIVTPHPDAGRYPRRDSPSHRRTSPIRLTGETRYPRWGAEVGRPTATTAPLDIRANPSSSPHRGHWRSPVRRGVACPVLETGSPRTPMRGGTHVRAAPHIVVPAPFVLPGKPGTHGGDRGGVPVASTGQHVGAALVAARRGDGGAVIDGSPCSHGRRDIRVAPPHPNGRPREAPLHRGSGVRCGYLRIPGIHTGYLRPNDHNVGLPSMYLRISFNDSSFLTMWS